MEIFRNEAGRWVIIHSDKIISQKFDSEDEAWHWADCNIDDQVLDCPNTFSEPLKYDGPR